MKKTTIAATACCLALFGGAPQARATPSGDCSPQVQQAQQDIRQNAIDGQTAIAKELFTLLPDTGFTGLSCLDNLMNGGMDVFFSPPSLSGLLQYLQNQVCAQAQTLYSQATQPLSQMTQTASLPVGEIIPGVNLGSISGGISVSPRQGTGGLGTITTNVGSVLSGGQTYTRQTYRASDFGGGLFGN